MRITRSVKWQKWSNRDWDKWTTLPKLGNDNIFRLDDLCSLKGKWKILILYYCMQKSDKLVPELVTYKEIAIKTGITLRLRSPGKNWQRSNRREDKSNCIGSLWRSRKQRDADPTYLKSLL